MIKLSNVKTIATRAIGSTQLGLKAYSPEALTVIGIVGVVSATILACRATMKLEQTVDKIHDGLEVAKDRKQLATTSNRDHQKDLAWTYAHGVYEVTKLYAPSIFLGTCSISCIVGANGILRRRNVALIAAYRAIDRSFSAYRGRVIEEFGPEKDLEYRRGLRSEGMKIDDKGNQKILTRVDPNGRSSYARFFDQLSVNWQNTSEYNLLFVKCQQNYANDRLHAKGYLFLNEAYDMLGIPRTKAGQIVGWRISEDGDNYVDFGIYDLQNERAREFVNGYEDSILLDFNVNGPILNTMQD